MGIIKGTYFLVRVFFVGLLSLAAEHLALQQQVGVCRQSVIRTGEVKRGRVGSLSFETDTAFLENVKVVIRKAESANRVISA